ncbi:MAG TPA: NUDIX hydrolase [bacterium]|jgi:8-oxo-dGTP pyrophosphatase MutT (NUDIX family)|nr:NUDIX hydrolase [Dictyoglomota bacterium]HHV81189.1 NUDIX hydrolase [bacterium]HOK29588.1 NUDIX hydrolase [bacterium]HOL54488.1 NUDIX hydrolase [bacterium]HOP55821.1 NUDIX hydrolase [bacterium]
MKEISSGCIVYKIENNDVYLLMILDRFGKWTFPKGKIEEGESLEETAIRELEEETGIKVKIEQYIRETNYSYTDENRGTIEKTVYWYLGRAESEEINPRYGEIKEAKWVQIDFATELCGYDSDRDTVREVYKILSDR